MPKDSAKANLLIPTTPKQENHAIGGLNYTSTGIHRSVSLHMTDSLMYSIALTLVPGIGAVQARNLITAFNDPRYIFKASISKLEKIEGIGPVRARSIKSFDDFKRAEDELLFIEKHGIHLLQITDEAYPKKLLHCDDAPLTLYYKGNASLNADKAVAVIGTRHNTPYGRQVCESFIAGLPEDVLVVSGLAHGIDSIAHQSALKLKLHTVGVLGHGLDRIYPGQNRTLAKRMLDQGGLLTDFISNTKPDKENFPKRNRIVAGMCDATVVIESGISGGSIITAALANSYNRDVFAFPGRIHDLFSEGCNELIRTQKAVLIRNTQDFLDWMNWNAPQATQPVQRSLFPDLSEDEQRVANHIRPAEVHIDELNNTGFTPGILSALLLSLEMKGWIISLPGKRYRWLG
ncbi:MAG TPA: DNA-processing protein DprA [Ferruginibacter sp.]|nr:DNA-processing protein DprA [Ferruginibacter sp.]HRO97087.1 DNA-processing protein DprA [Ferruginibacter sp.]